MAGLFNRSKLRACRRDPDTAPTVNEGEYPVSTASLQWSQWNPDMTEFPNGMVCAGKLETGEMAYISRADVGDQLVAGFMLISSSTMYAAYGCREHTLQNFEILTVEDQDAVVWQKCSNGQRPNATGCKPFGVGSRYGEQMIVGRTCTPLTDGRTYQGHILQLSRHALTGDGVHRPGKIHQSHNCLYIPYSGREYIFNDHEMLMLKGTPGSLLNICRWSILKRLRLAERTNADIDELPLPKVLKRFVETGEK